MQSQVHHRRSWQPQHHRNKSLSPADAVCSNLPPAEERKNYLATGKLRQWIMKRPNRHLHYNLSRKISYLHTHMAHCYSIQEVSQDLNTFPSSEVLHSVPLPASQDLWLCISNQPLYLELSTIKLHNKSDISWGNFLAKSTDLNLSPVLFENKIYLIDLCFYLLQ